MDQRLFIKWWGSAISAGINSMRLMAWRGLVKPEEVEKYFHDLTSHFDAMPGDTPEQTAQFEQARAHIENHLAPWLAEIHQMARDNWRG